MKYTQEILRRMQEIARENPEMSFGELQMTCFHREAVKNRQSLYFFTKLKDEDAYTIVENVKIVKENPVTEEELETWVNNK